MVAFFITLRGLFGAMRRGWSDPEFRALGFLVTVLVTAGTIFYWQAEGWSVVDSLYFSVITLTTVGYGDLAPASTAGKLFTVVYILLGLGILVSFLSMVARHAIDIRVERQTSGGSNGPSDSA
jgi:voltage-gated potassium channel